MIIHNTRSQAPVGVQRAVKQEDAYTPRFSQVANDSFSKTNAVQFGTGTDKYNRSAFLALMNDIHDYIQYGDRVKTITTKMLDYDDFAKFVNWSKLDCPLAPLRQNTFGESMEDYIQKNLNGTYREEIGIPTTPRQRVDRGIVKELWKEFRQGRKALWRAEGDARSASPSDNES